MFENILVETADQVTVITVNRPQALNALNKKTVADESITHAARISLRFESHRLDTAMK